MKKLWRCICFLVLAMSAMSRGLNHTEPSHPPDTNTPLGTHESEATDPTASPTLNTNSFTSGTNAAVDATSQTDEATDPPDVASDNTTQEVGTNATAEVTTSTGLQEKKPAVTDVATVLMTTESSTSPAPVQSSGSSWGYAALVLILLVIVVLCVILYYLRRVSRTYSFDLQRPSPGNRLSEPTGTFEPVYLDDLDRPVLKDQITTDDPSPPPVANGTTVPSEEKDSSGDSAPQEQPDVDGVETSPVSNTSSSVSEDSSEKASGPLDGTILIIDGLGEEQQNENNNNPSVCSTDPFVEINLDDPAWCDQLLTSPEATSSVLPFTSFSSSSSSSS